MGKNTRWLGFNWTIEKRLYTAIGIVTFFVSFAAVGAQLFLDSAY